MRAHHVVESMKALAPMLRYHPERSRVRPWVWDKAIDECRRACTFEFGDVYPPQQHQEFGADLLRRGLFRLPFPVVLFTWAGPPGTVMALAAQTDDQLFLTGVVCQADGNHMPCIRGVIDLAEPMRPRRFTWDHVWEDEELADVAAQLDRHPGEYNDDMEDCANQVTSAVLGAVSMLISKDVVQTTHEPSAKLNKARVRKDKPIIRDTIMVSLTPAARAAYLADGSDRAGIKLHWRRGHYRTLRHDRYRGERVVPVAPCLVGAADGVAIPAPKQYKLEPLA